MEAPYVQVKSKPFIAPLEEMEEIVIAALISNGYGQIHPTEYPKGVSATKTQRTVYGERQFTKDSAVEIQWKEDPNPPAIFTELAKDRPHINAALVSIQLKDMQSNQGQAKTNLESLWKELTKRAQQTSDAVALRKPPTDHGTAQWATLSQLIAEDYVQESTKEDISNRLILGSLQGRLISVPKRFTEAHAIIQGPPGSGKSRTIINTQLIERLATSAIVTEVTAGEDLKPTVYGITAGYRAKNGHKIYYINPSDLDNSTRFNPIDFIESIDDAIYYADLIITNTTSNTHIGDQIWTQSETHLLTALLLYAWGLGGKSRSIEGGKSNLGHVRSLLRLGPIGLYSKIQEDGIDEAKAQFGEFLRNSSPNFRLGVFSGLIQRLNPWLNPRIRKLTEVSDFDPDDLRKSLFTFYLAYPVHRRDYRPIMSLALNFLTKLALRRKFAHPLTYILDEFAAYGRVPGIDDMQATVRNRQIGIILGFQDLQQLAKVYSHTEAEVLFTNCDTKIIFATGSPKAQDQISKMLGQTTKVKKSISGSGHIHRQTYGAPLLSPAEIGRIPDQHIVVLRNKRNPIILMTCEPGKYEHYAKNYPLVQRPKRLIESEIEQQCARDKEVEFSERLARQQVLEFERRYKAKVLAQNALEKARVRGTSNENLLQLGEKVRRAQAAYMALFSPIFKFQSADLGELNLADDNGIDPGSVEIQNEGCTQNKQPYEYQNLTDDPYTTLGTSHHTNNETVESEKACQSEFVSELSKLVGGAMLAGLPQACQRNVGEAIILFEICKDKAFSFAPVFTPLLGPLDTGSRNIISNLLSKHVPNRANEQDSFFELPSAQPSLQLQAQNLRKELLQKSGLSPIGLLRFCLTFQNKERLGGIFRAIPDAFERLRTTRLRQDIDAVNEFRNTYIAHPEAELTDYNIAEKNLKLWIEVIIQLYRTAP